MKTLFVWCAIMTAEGPVHKKAEVVLRDQFICDRITCNRALLVQYSQDTQSELIAENRCLFSKPNNSEEN